MDNRRIKREKRTIDAMVKIFCKAGHSNEAGLCKDCREFLAYAHLRLERCRYKNHKPTCGHCPVHCYNPGMKARAMEIMKYSGPRMGYRHPILSLFHFLDGFIKVSPPRRPAKNIPA